MFAINKTLVATAAVIAVGIVTVMDLAQSRPEPTAAATVAARFPAAGEMMIPINIDYPADTEGTSTHGAAGSNGCVHEHWPYIADECLHATDGERRKPPARTIPIGRRGEPVHLASR